MLLFLTLMKFFITLIYLITCFFQGWEAGRTLRKRSQSFRKPTFDRVEQ